jgi:hypothetical protein
VTPNYRIAPFQWSDALFFGGGMVLASNLAPRETLLAGLYPGVTKYLVLDVDLAVVADGATPGRLIVSSINAQPCFGGCAPTPPPPPTMLQATVFVLDALDTGGESLERARTWRLGFRGAMAPQFGPIRLFDSVDEARARLRVPPHTGAAIQHYAFDIRGAEVWSLIDDEWIGECLTLAGNVITMPVAPFTTGLS